MKSFTSKHGYTMSLNVKCAACFRTINTEVSLFDYTAVVIFLTSDITIFQTRRGIESVNMKFKCGLYAFVVPAQ